MIGDTKNPNTGTAIMNSSNANASFGASVEGRTPSAFRAEALAREAGPSAAPRGAHEGARSAETVF